MRKAVYSILMTALAMLLFTAGALAATSGTFGNNLSWNLDDNGVLTISGQGDMPNNTNPWKTQGESITSVVIGDGITRIGSGAFGYYGSYSIKSVTISDSVASIGVSAFSGCGLESISIPAGVTSIGTGAFKSCSYLTEINVVEGNSNYLSIDGVLYDKEITSLIAYAPAKEDTEFTVPQTVAVIGDSAFYASRNIAKIILPAGITSIGQGAFSLCDNLREINLPDSLTIVNNQSFSNCSNLSAIVLPSALKTVGDYAFQWTGLTEIILPDTLISIGRNAFNASELSEIIIPESVTSIGENAFYSSTLVKVHEGTYAEDYAVANGLNYQPIKKYEYTTSDQQVTITKYLGNETSVIIPERLGGNPVNGIATGAFSDCDFLEEITIRAHITSIADGALPGKTGLKIYCCKNTAALTYAQNNEISYELIRNIVRSGTCGSDAAWTLDDEGCLVISGTGEILGALVSGGQAYGKTFTSLIIEEGITKIGSYAFRDSINLENATIADSVEVIGDSAFSGCSSLTSIAIPNEVTAIGYGVFYNCTSLSSVYLPDGIMSVNGMAFYKCPVTFFADLDTVTAHTISKANYGFRIDGAECDVKYVYNGEEVLGITAANIPDNVTAITLPDCVTRIEHPGFSGKSSLRSISFPDEITYINETAFYQCLAVRYADADSTTALTMSRLDYGYAGFRIPGTECDVTYTFEDDQIQDMILAHIPEDIISLNVPAGVTCIQQRAFKDHQSIVSVVIPDSVTIIEDGAFWGSSIKSISLGDGLVSIGRDSFRECTQLEQIDIPSSVETIAHCAFQGCSGLEEVVIPEGVKTLGSSVFYKCQNIEEVRFPASITSIGGDTLYGMNSLQRIMIPACTTQAFQWTSSVSYLKQLIILDEPHETVIDAEIPATCTRTGRTAGSHCSKCNMTLSGREIIPMLDHIPVVDEGYPATETEAGLTDGSHCGVCGTILVAQQEIHPLWDIETQDEKVSLVKYYGTATNVSIPSVVDGLPVTEIRDNAFIAPNIPARVYIPAGVKTIGSSAFAEAVTVYCPEYSEADFWAGDREYETVYTDDVIDGTFHIIQMPGDFELECGEMAQITAVIWPITGQESIIWSSSAPDILSVSDGIVRALKPGNATITVRAAGTEGSISVRAFALPEDFTLSETDAYVASKDTMQLSVAEVTPAGADLTVTWTSSNTDIVTVTSDGILSAKRIGNATIYATSQNEIVRECVVTVCYPVTDISFAADNYQVNMYESLQMEATVTTQNGNVFTNKLVTFTSSDEAIATVDRNGNVTGINEGQVIISASANGHEAETAVEVLSPKAFDDCEHRWINETFEWNAGTRTVTEIQVCNLNATHTRTITVTNVLILPDDMKEIETEAFAGIDCVAVIVPDGCTYIGSKAFAECKSLKYVKLLGNTIYEANSFDEGIVIDDN